MHNRYSISVRVNVESPENSRKRIQYKTLDTSISLVSSVLSSAKQLCLGLGGLELAFHSVDGESTIELDSDWSEIDEVDLVNF